MERIIKKKVFVENDEIREKIQSLLIELGLKESNSKEKKELCPFVFVNDKNFAFSYDYSAYKKKETHTSISGSEYIKLLEKVKYEPIEGDFAIFWDKGGHVNCFMTKFKKKIVVDEDDMNEGDVLYATIAETDWDCCIKWDGTRDQMERVMRGELKN